MSQVAELGVCLQAPSIGGAGMGLEAPLNTLTFQGHGQSQFDLKQTVNSVLLYTQSLWVLLPGKEVQPHCPGFRCHCRFCFLPSTPPPCPFLPRVHRSQGSAGPWDFCGGFWVRSHCLGCIMNAGICGYWWAGAGGAFVPWPWPWPPACVPSRFQREALRPQEFCFGLEAAP